jgi:hypothetical protein
MRGVGVLLLLGVGCTRAAPGYCDPQVCVRPNDLGPGDGAHSISGPTEPRDLAGPMAPHDLADSNPTLVPDLGSVPSTMPGTIPLGGRCLGSANPPSTVDQCVSGAVCTVSHGARDVQLCHQSCQIDGDCQQATFPNGAAPACEGGTATTPGTCSISCNPVGAAVGKNGCGDGLSCYLLSDHTRSLEYTDCIAPGGGGEAATCNSDLDCAPGLLCINILFSLCEYTCINNNDCPGTESCMPFFNVSSVYGYCSN